MGQGGSGAASFKFQGEPVSLVAFTIEFGRQQPESFPPTT